MKVGDTGSRSSQEVEKDAGVEISRCKSLGLKSLMPKRRAQSKDLALP